MSTEFFWQDLWLKIWWALKEPQGTVAVFFILVFPLMYYRFHTYLNGRSIGLIDIVICIVGIICVVLCIASIFAPKIYPYVYDHSPDTSVKEELRQKDLSVGDIVWVVKRDESGTPTSIDEHIIFAKKSESILVDEALTDGVHSNNTALPIALVSYPLSDCYSDKEEAEAVIEAASAEEK